MNGGFIVVEIVALGSSPSPSLIGEEDKAVVVVTAVALLSTVVNMR